MIHSANTDMSYLVDFVVTAALDRLAITPSFMTLSEYHCSGSRHLAKGLGLGYEAKHASTSLRSIAEI